MGQSGATFTQADLTLDQWREVYDHLTSGLAELYSSFSLHFNRTHHVVGSSNVTTDRFPIGSSGRELRLETLYDEGGVFTTLHIGGPVGEGYWRIHKNTSLSGHIEVAGVSDAAYEGRPSGGITLHLGHPLLNGRPGNDPTTADLMDDIFNTLTHWRQNAH